MFAHSTDTIYNASWRASGRQTGERVELRFRRRAEDASLLADLCRIRKDLWLREEKATDVTSKKDDVVLFQTASARGDLLSFKVLQVSLRA